MKLRTFALLSPLLALGASALSAQTILMNHDGTQLGSDLLQVDDAEITPDGKYIVSRENRASTAMRIYDAMTGLELQRYHTLGGGSLSGVAQDAIAVTNSRAVMLGHPSRIVDLTNLNAPDVAIMNTGLWPRDLAITPDGTSVAIRGGSSMGTSDPGGLFVFDLATGTQLAHAPGIPMFYGSSQFDVDSVAVTDRYAAFTSSPQGVETQVTIMDLHPAGGGSPTIAYETGPFGDNHIVGTPHDLTMTPDGNHLVVRSGMAVALFDLTAASPQMLWVKRLAGNPGPMDYSAMDSVEATNDRIATISRWSVAGFGAQVDVFDMAGNQRSQVIEGDPHDLAITPNGRRLVVRTHTSVYLYGLEIIAGGPNLSYLDKQDSLGTHTSYGAGYDSVQVTADLAVTTSRVGETTDARVWELGHGQLKQVAQHIMDARPVDVAIVPSGDKAVVSGFSHVMIVDLVSKGVLLNTQTNTGGGYGWCDGVATNDSTAVVFGSYTNGQAGSHSFEGWLTVIDLFDEPTVFCATNANSTGETAATHANGSASVASNDLSLVASDLPANAMGSFLYGDGQVSTPFGGGVLCVGGQSGYFSPQTANAEGVAVLGVDSMNLPFGSPGILMGSSRSFQFIFRDGIAGQINTSAGLEVMFTP